MSSFQYIIGSVSAVNILMTSSMMMILDDK